MKRKIIEHKGQKIEGDFFNKNDLKRVLKIYRKWLEINEDCKLLGVRSVNLPEAISEIIVAYIDKGIRTNNAVNKTAKKDKKLSLAFDTLTSDGKAVQVKGSSVKNGTLTSFSPKSKNYDKLILVDAYSNGMWDSTLKIIEIDHKKLESTKVNGDQTFKQQMDGGRRPRLNLLEWAVKNNAIKKTTVVNLQDLISTNHNHGNVE